MFVLVYSNDNDNAKTYKTKRYYLLEGTISYYNVAIDSDINRYEEITKWTIDEGEDYNIECLLDYKYIKIIIN